MHMHYIVHNSDFITKTKPLSSDKNRAKLASVVWSCGEDDWEAINVNVSGNADDGRPRRTYLYGDDWCSSKSSGT